MLVLRTKMNSFKHVTSNLGIFVLMFIATTESAPNGNESFYSTDPRIINGTEAELKNTMHQVSIRRRLSDSYFFGTGHICGGSLIAHNVVLTAAHCFVNFQLPKKPYIEASKFIVVMGNLNRFERNNDTLIFDIHHVIVRIPKFNIDTFYRDLAVVFLNSTVPANHPTVRPIRLNTQPVPAGTICQVTGWGRTEQGFISDVLMTLDVPIISNVFCDTQTNFEPGYILDGMMCAGYLEGGSDACDGDSGGPMVCNGTLAGITSWSDGCAKPLYPGVYTDVAYFEPWIRKVVHVMGVDLEGGTMSSYKNSNVLIIAMAFVVTCLIGSHS